MKNAPEVVPKVFVAVKRIGRDALYIDDPVMDANEPVNDIVKAVRIVG